MASDESPAAGETIGQRLKRLRLEKGLSQRELAAPGVSYAYISRIEAGTRQPSVKALRKLAAKLGVTADYLETGSNLDSVDARELHLADLELAVRLGEWDGAEKQLGAVLADALTAGDHAASMRSRVALAALAQERGEFPEAAALLEAAVDEEEFLPVEHYDIYTKLGRAYAQAGRTRDAANLLERCMEAAEESDERTLAARYATLLSYALSDMGELARAESVIERALDFVKDTTDPYMRVRLYWSMARLAHREGRETVALANARKAIALLEATDDSFHLARAHLLAARISMARADVDTTEAHVDKAAKLLGLTPAVEDRAEIEILRSRVATARGNGEKGVKYAARAVALEGISPIDQGYASAALADALALIGEHGPAEDAYRRSVELHENQGLARDAAQTCRSWGHLLQKIGRDHDAAAILDRATDFMLRAAPAETHADR